MDLYLNFGLHVSFLEKHVDIASSLMALDATMEKSVTNLNIFLLRIYLFLFCEFPKDSFFLFKI